MSGDCRLPVFANTLLSMLAATFLSAISALAGLFQLN